jgi:hypothetical protein
METYGRCENCKARTFLKKKINNEIVDICYECKTIDAIEWYDIIPEE